MTIDARAAVRVAGCSYDGGWRVDNQRFEPGIRPCAGLDAPASTKKDFRTPPGDFGILPFAKRWPFKTHTEKTCLRAEDPKAISPEHQTQDPTPTQPSFFALGFACLVWHPTL